MKAKNLKDQAKPMIYKSKLNMVKGNILYFHGGGFIFGSNGARYVRISLCATQEKLTQALNRIRQLEVRS